jgi:hypothetical protein
MGSWSVHGHQESFAASPVEIPELIMDPGAQPSRKTLMARLSGPGMTLSCNPKIGTQHGDEFYTVPKLPQSNLVVDIEATDRYKNV